MLPGLTPPRKTSWKMTEETIGRRLHHIGSDITKHLGNFYFIPELIKDRIYMIYYQDERRFLTTAELWMINGFMEMLLHHRGALLHGQGRPTLRSSRPGKNLIMARSTRPSWSWWTVAVKEAMSWCSMTKGSKRNHHSIWSRWRLGNPRGWREKQSTLYQQSVNPWSPESARFTGTGFSCWNFLVATWTIKSGRKDWRQSLLWQWWIHGHYTTASTSWFAPTRRSRINERQLTWRS